MFQKWREENLNETFERGELASTSREIPRITANNGARRSEFA
jgi:hypothetical protein